VRSGAGGVDQAVECLDWARQPQIEQAALVNVETRVAGGARRVRGGRARGWFEHPLL
jgi:hypothetical protein